MKHIVWVARTTLTTGFLTAEQPEGTPYPKTTINIRAAQEFDTADEAIAATSSPKFLGCGITVLTKEAA